jgi:hypothetical protein
MIPLVKLNHYQLAADESVLRSEVEGMGLTARIRGTATRKPPEVPLEAVQSLLTRVIWQAVADLGSEAYRSEAEAFFGSAAFEEYCEILGWNVRRARASLSRFVGSGGRISGNHLLPAQPVPATARAAALN